MRRVLLTKVQADAVLADDLFDPKGVSILRAGTSLSQRYLDRLQRMGLVEVVIEDPVLEDVDARPIISPRTRQVGLVIFSHLSQQVADLDTLRPVAAPAGLEPYVKSLLSDLGVSPPVRFDPVAVAGTDYLPGHALNVSGLAACMALNSDHRSLASALAQAGLLADLGLVRVPVELRRESDDLDEAQRELLYSHPDVSLALMSQLFNAHVKAAVAAHHERMDGSGYPRGRKGDELQAAARLLIVADSYMTLVREGLDGQGLMPHEALEVIMGMAGQEYDLQSVELLMRTVSPFPPGVSVRLSSGRRAVVVEAGSLATRPVVRLMEGQLSDLDLSQPQHQTELITEVLYD